METLESLAAEILLRYGVKDVRTALPLRGTRNTNIVAETGSGKFFLRRRYSGYSGREWAEFDHAAMEHLTGRGAPVPELLHTEDGEAAAVHEGQVWELFRFVESDPMPEDPILLAREVARSLAEFHKAGEGFERRYEKKGPWGELTPERMRASGERILRESPDTSDALGVYLNQIQLAERRLAVHYNSLPATLCHGDVHPANLIFSAGRIVMTDLDWLGRRPRLYDLAWGVVFFGAKRRRALAGDSIWDLTQPFEFVPGYLDAFLRRYEDDCSPLSAVE